MAGPNVSCAVHVVVPVKPLVDGKSRLASTLSPAARRQLNCRMLERTLNRLQVFPGAERSWIVSRCADVLTLAGGRGFNAVFEPGLGGLNDAMALGVRCSVAAGAESVLSMPVDLPWGNGEDLRSLLACTAGERICLLVPDQHGTGTNLLWQSRVAMTGFAFGVGSLMRHAELARRAGLTPVVAKSALFGFDIDEPGDLRRWQALSRRPAVCRPSSSEQALALGAVV